MTEPRNGARGRLAFITLHTSPLDQPGDGDAGGMNVYVRSVTERLEERGFEVDIFTRCSGRETPDVHPLGPRSRIIQVPAGPCSPVPKEDLHRYVPTFIEELSRMAPPGRYDVIQSHYWLSGLVGRELRRRWDAPLVALFHTLAKVKNLSLGDGDRPEPPIRVDGEALVVADADRIVVPTEIERQFVCELYGAGPEMVRLAPPGVDRRRFRPLPKDRAKRALGLEGRPVVLFVGRLQSLKRPDVAVRTMARLVPAGRRMGSEPVLAVVGGPGRSTAEGSGSAELLRLAAGLGIPDRIRVLTPRPHPELPWLYAAADVVLMPSRTESFGLVALEAQACGIPVVAASVGGLRHVVEHGGSGFLVEGDDPRRYAETILPVLSDRDLARRLSLGGVRRAAAFTWERTVGALLGVYGELRPDLLPNVAPDRAPA